MDDASTQHETPPHSDRPTHIPWPPILLVVIVAGAILLGYFVPLPWPGVNDWPARVVGLGIGAAGLVLLTWAAITLRRHNTTILPHQRSDVLVTTGPFAWRRNPIYLADAMLMLGAAELTKNIWFAIAAPVFMILVTWLAILPEERHLLARFGDAYRDYRDRTRRWI